MPIPDMAVLEMEKRNRVAYLWMNRPEAKNAINLELHNARCAAWDDLEKDGSVDVVIITGTGDAFCGGMDLKTHVSAYVNATPGKIADWVKLGLGGTTRGEHRFPKPVTRPSTVAPWPEVLRRRSPPTSASHRNGRSSVSN